MITGINHVTLSVKNLDESFRFYRDLLGFKPLMKSRKIAYFLAGDAWFCLDEDAQTGPKPSPEYTHIAFSVSNGDFTELQTRIRDAGTALWKENTSEGESLYFLDPNGHKLEIHVGDWRSRIRDTKARPWEDGIEFFV